MKKRTVFLVCFICFLALQHTYAQENWGTYSQSVAMEDYEGYEFRYIADVKALPTEDSSSIRLFARIDKEEGIGFFENMWKKPIRDSEWKTYTLKGTVDENAQKLVFGVICQFNGKFYIDNIKVEVRKDEEDWKALVDESFEKGNLFLSQGHSMGDNGLNDKYVATVIKEKRKTRASRLQVQKYPITGTTVKLENLPK